MRIEPGPLLMLMSLASACVVPGLGLKEQGRSKSNKMGVGYKRDKFKSGQKKAHERGVGKAGGVGVRGGGAGAGAEPEAAAAQARGREKKG